MNATLALLEQALLVVSVFRTRPAGIRATRLGLLVHGTLLCLCLLIRVAGAGPGLPLACLAATLAEIGLVVALTGRERGREPPMPAMPLWPMGVGVLAVWLAFRLVPAGTAAGAAIALGIVLCGAVSMLVASDDRTRWASLLLAGHGVLLFSGVMPGFGWSGLLMALPLQAFVLSRFCARPVWSDQIAGAPE